MEKLKGYRTLFLNAAVFIGMVLAAMTGTITDPGILQFIVIAQAVVNVVLRFLTDSPVGSQTPTVLE